MKTIRTTTCNGVQTIFPVTFDLGYLDRTHIYVYVGDTPTNQVSYTWINSNAIETTTVLPAGTILNVRRITPRTLFNDYTNGAILEERNLDDSFKQALMLLEEVSDGFMSSEEAWYIMQDINMQGHKLLNVGEGSEPTDGVNLGQVARMAVVGQGRRYTQDTKPLEVNGPDFDGVTWFHTGELKTYTYFCDTDSCQWVEDQPNEGQSGVVSEHALADVASEVIVAGVTAKSIAGVVNSTVVFSEQEWGADPTGVLSNTTAFNNAYNYAKTIGGELRIPAGRYKGQFLINAEAPVKCAGRRRTVLLPETTSYVVKTYGVGGDANLGVIFEGASIEGPGNIGTGLYCGDPSGTGFSNGRVADLEIKGFNNNWFIAQAIVCTFENIWTHDGVYGINFDNERNVTTCSFKNIRSTTNEYNCKLASGHVLNFIGCAFESAKIQNLSAYTGNSSGPTKVLFSSCWFEDITGTTGSNRTCLFFDMDPSKSATKGMDIKFDRCTISSPNGIPDIKADNAQNVLFDTCAFSATADAFSATKFVYATGGNTVRIKLLNCGKVQESPTVAMYVNFPAVTRVSGGVFGYSYEFHLRNGKRVTNYTKVSTAGDVTSLQSAHLDVISLDTTAGSVNVNSLSNGSDGQRVTVIKQVSANNVVIKNNGTGTEPIITGTGSDITLTGVAAIALVCDNGKWYKV